MNPVDISKEDFLLAYNSLPDLAEEIGNFTQMNKEDVFLQLKKHIEVHKYFIEEKLPISLSLKQAIHSWYKNVYSHLYSAMEETAVEKIFPQMSRLELYLQISDHMYYLLEEKKNVEIFNLKHTATNAEKDKLTAYIFIPFNQVVYSYISIHSNHWWTRFFARLRLTKVRTKPKFRSK